MIIIQIRELFSENCEQCENDKIENLTLTFGATTKKNQTQPVRCTMDTKLSLNLNKMNFFFRFVAENRFVCILNDLTPDKARKTIISIDNRIKSIAKKRE